MQIHIHLHDDRETKQSLNLINNKLDKIMAKAQENFDVLMGRLDTVTTNIAADYKKLLEEIQNNTVSPESIAKAQLNIEKLEALGASVDNPVPEPPVEG